MADSLPTPITREDRYLACLCGVCDEELPAPITREERYLALLCSAYSSDLPSPITRTDCYLAYLCGTYTGDLPAPITRADYYLAALCGAYSGDSPSPITRSDYYLHYLASGGVMCDKTASGVTIDVADAAAQPLNSLTLYGWSTQDSTPTPEEPVDIVSAADNGEVAVTVDDGSSNSQTLILAAANGLPGIQVQSNGNYTDETGQMWVADEIKLNKDGSGVYVQRLRQIVDVHVTAYNASEQFAAISAYDMADKGVFWPSSVVRVPILSNRFAFTTTHKIHGDGFGYSKSIRFYLDGPTSADEMTAWFEENPTTVIYPLADPVETALTADEIAAFLALKAYNGTTIITNDADAYMEVGYKAKKE